MGKAVQHSSSAPRLPKLRQSKATRLTAVGLVSALVTLSIQAVGGWRALDHISYVMLFRVRQAIAPLQWDPRIAVIAVDDNTLERYGQFPVSRHYYTDLLDQLIVAQPAAIGFDLLFVDPSPHDEVLGAAIERHWTVVLPVAVSPQGTQLRPVPPLSSAAAALGHVLVTSDGDGITRFIEPYQGDVPAFGMAMVQVYNESQAAIATDQSAGSGIGEGLQHQSAIRGNAPSTLVPKAPLWLNWPAPITAPRGCAPPKPGHLQSYAMDCVLLGQVSPATFSNRIVLIGVTATGIDPLRTPFNSAVPSSNVYLHAAVIDNLLNGRSLRRPPGWVLIPIVASISLLSFELVRQPRLRLAIFGLPVVWGALASLGFAANLWLPVAAPVATILLTLIGAQVNAQWEKQQLMELFEIHVDPTAAALLWQQRHQILKSGQLPIQEAIATVLFVDIRGFTTVAEDLSSHALMGWLNRYLDAITQSVTARGGVVDKFIGDEVMAYFCTPAHQADSTTVSAQAVSAIETCL
ncbi:MAG: adenylate/guanylate cyclase domain-containing protein, partial [Elainellaceae cyanobacterium]